MKYYTTYETPLENKCFTEKQMHEVYRALADENKYYPPFDIWFTDMIKLGVFERVKITAHIMYVSYPT